jgi:two-component system, chemotaxis family, chemotaxis protein CheY
VYMKILVVDDSLFQRKILKKILEEGGYEVAGEAVNGKEGIEKATRMKPDVIIMDIIMPDISGIEAIKNILEVNPGIRVIVCSSDIQKMRIEEAEELGAAYYITKPVDGNELLKAIQTAGRTGQTG